MGQFSKYYRTIYSKNCHYALKNMGLGSGKNLFRIPDPGVEKGTGSRIRVRNTARKYDPSCSSRILIFYPSRNSDPGVKKTLIKKVLVLNLVLPGLGQSQQRCPHAQFADGERGSGPVAVVLSGN